MQLYQQESLEVSEIIDIRSVEPQQLVMLMTNNQKKSARRARELIGKNKGRWSQEEQRQYYEFLKDNLGYFENKDNRRYDKVFKMMSSKIRTRTSDQCRTHHQKLEARYKKLTKIMQSLKMQFGEVENSKIIKRYEQTIGLGANDYFNSTAFSSASKASQSTHNTEQVELCDYQDFYLNPHSLDESIEFQMQEIDIFVTNNGSRSFLTLED